MKKKSCIYTLDSPWKEYPYSLDKFFMNFYEKRCLGAKSSGGDLREK